MSRAGSSTGVHRGIVGFISALVVVTGLLAMAVAFASPAFGSKAVVSFFGSTGAAGGQFAATGNGVGGSGVYDATGDVYVADRGNHRVEQFSAAGAFIRAWGLNVDATAPGTGFEVCTQASGNVCQAGATSASTGGALSSPQGVAVDQATGNVYVTDQGFRRVDVFSATGSFIRSFGQDVVKTGSPNNAPAASERQTVTLAGAAGGAFRLSFRGLSSAPIAWNATAVEVQDALRAVSTVGPGSVTVTGSAGGPYTVTFAGGLANAPVPEMSSDVTDLLPGGSTATVATTVPGATGFEVCDTMAGNTAADCQTGVAGSSAGAFGAAMGYPAVAPPGAPNAGNVVVSDVTGLRVQEFTSNGVFVRARGNDVVSLGPGNAGTGEVQSVTVVATSGKFSLTFSGQTTALLDWNASAAQVQAALNALSNIGAVGGNVTVSGGPGDATGSAPYVVSFGGTLRGQNVAQLTVNPGGLGIATGTMLSCSSTTSAATSEFQWLRNGLPIAGATSANYVTGFGDVGAAVQCQVFKLNANAGSTQITSPATAQVVSPFPATAPASTTQNTIAAPAIFSGALTVGGAGGAVLRCSAGAWTGAPTSFTYQWYRNGVAVGSPTTTAATTNDYTVQTADLATAAVFQCRVTATNAGGATVLASANRATAPPPSAPSAPNSNASMAALTTATTVTGGAPAAEVCAAASLDVCKAGVSGAGAGMFGSGSPNRVAVDSSGQVYAVDGGNNRLQKLNYAGTAASSFGAGAFTPGRVTDVAIDPSNDDVHAVKAGVSEVQVLTITAEAGTYTLSFAGATTDPIPFDAKGADITAKLEPLTPVGAGNVTVTGNLTGPVKTRTVTFTGALATTDVPAITGDTALLDEAASIEVETTTPGVSSALLRFDSSANLAETSVLHPNISTVSGLAVASASAAAGAGNAYLSAPLAAGQRVFTLGTPVPPVAGMAATPCTAIASNAITFNGTVNPTAFSTGWRFEYVTDATFQASGFANAVKAPAVDAPLGFTDSSPHDVSQPVAGLAANTTYHVRLVATKTHGAGSDTSAAVTCATQSAAPEVSNVGPISITDTTTRLNGFVNPNGQPTTYRFQYVDDDTFQADVDDQGPGHGFDHATDIPDTPADTGSGSAAVPVSRQVEDLQPNTTYHFRLVATNTTGPTTAGEQTFTTRTTAQSPPLPQRGYERVSGIDTNGLKVWNFLASKSGDHYAYFADLPVPGAENGGSTFFRASRSSDGSGSWSQQFIGLPAPPPGTPVETPAPDVSHDDISVAAFPTSYGLDPDDRNNAQDIYVREVGGEAQWISRSPVIAPGTPQTEGNGGVSHYISPDGGRVLFVANRNLLPEDATGSGKPGLYEWVREPFDARQSLTVDAAAGTYSLVFGGEATGATGVGDLTDGSAVVENISTSTGKFVAGEVVSGPDIPAGTIIETVGADTLTLSASATADGVSASLTADLPAAAPASVVQAALNELPTIGGLAPVAGSVAVTGGPGGPGGGSAYLIAFGGGLGSTYVPQIAATNVDLSGGASNLATATRSPGGNLRLVAIAPGSTSGLADESGLGSMAGISAGIGRRDTYANAVSRDGSRIAFQSGVHKESMRLYVRLDHESTVEASANAFDATPLMVNYAGADRDMERVFFTSASPLTADSNAPDTANGDADLYVYDIETDTIRDLTPRPAGGAGIERVYAVSDDGRRVYFTATSQLVAGEGVAGAPNLYLLELDDSGDPAGAPVFIATIDGIEDDTAAGIAAGSLDHSGLVASAPWREVSLNSSGSVLAFRNRLPAVPGIQTGGRAQVFAYDAERDELSCVSCPADGSAPTATARLAPANAATRELEADAPGAIGNAFTSPFAPHPPNVSEAGAVVFQTASALVPGDSNTRSDVYEYRGGRLGLISAGIGDKLAIFASASVDGSTVFFLSSEGLVPGADAGVQRVFAARVGGGFKVPPAAAAPCVGEECRSVVSSPEGDPAPGSVGSADRDDVGGSGRLAVELRMPSAAVRSRAARTGRLSVGVWASRAGVVRLSARARVDRRARLVGRAAKRLSKRGVARVDLRLSGRARRALRRGEALSVAIEVRASGARTRTITVRLAGAKR